MTQDGIVDRRQEDWDAYWFIQAIKGHQVNARSVNVSIISGIERPLDMNDPTAFAHRMFREMVERRLTIDGEAVLAPIPDSGCDLTCGRKPKTTVLADLIASVHPHVKVWPGLKWRNSTTPSRSGGTRDPQQLYENLVLCMPAPSARAILIDDVVTSGGHLRAADAFLRANGIQCGSSLSIGRTAYVSRTPAFATVAETIPDFEPSTS